MDKRTCSQDGCHRALHAKRMCKAHYAAQYRLEKGAELNRARRKDGPEPRRCPACGETFQPTNHHQIACPPTADDRARQNGQARSKCARKIQNARHCNRPLIVGKVGQVYDCAYCGALCVPGDNVAPHASKFCSSTGAQSCKRLWHCHGERGTRRRASVHAKLESAARGTRGTGTWIAGTCTECGDDFLRKGQASGLCSKRCSRKASKRARRAAGRKRIGLHEIADRDGWTCHLCGKDVHDTLVVPHLLAPTLDHIVPIALGGRHERYNLALAHFICNSRKGAGTAVPVGRQCQLV